jgi:hypothetical protein
MKKQDVKILQVRMGIEDYAKLETNAQNSGVTISEHARQILLNDDATLLGEEMNKTIREMDFLTFLSLKSVFKRVNKKRGGTISPSRE